MGDKSAIEWTDATWNPITGCSKVSPGCAHCYAETLALTRMRGTPGYPGLPWTPENAAANVTLRPERLTAPLRWTRPRRIFVNSMSDLFHELVPDAFIDQVFSIMALATGHTFQVLTKRPERMREYLTTGFLGDGREALVREAIRKRKDWNVPQIQAFHATWPLPNVWLGTSVENQHWADVRIPELLATPAAVRFLSMEPLLGPVELREEWLQCPDCRGRGWYLPNFAAHHVEPCARCQRLARRVGVQLGDGKYARPGNRLAWLIVGGESGPIHRAMDPEWVRAIRDQATAAGIPFLFKQWGGRTSKAGGRELDGRTWDEYPA
jgi:protein gp37